MKPRMQSAASTMIANYGTQANALQAAAAFSSFLAFRSRVVAELLERKPNSLASPPTIFIRAQVSGNQVNAGVVDTRALKTVLGQPIKHERLCEVAGDFRVPRAFENVHTGRFHSDVE